MLRWLVDQQPPAVPDKLAFPDIDLSAWRSAVALLAMCVLLMVSFGMRSETVNSVMLGAVAMASSIAALFFLCFWRQTRDTLFLLFSLAFAVDALTRLALGLGSISDDQEPLVYIARLVTFALIAIAIVNKNRGGVG